MYLRRILGVALSLPALLALSCGDSGENVGDEHDAGTDQRVADHHVEADVARDGGDGDGATEVGDAPGEGDAEAMPPIDADSGEGDALVPGPCGDGVLNLGEACDDGFRDACGACNADCSGPGDGRLHAACVCAAVSIGDAGAADDGGEAGLAADAGSAIGEDFSNDMIGCPGHVSWDRRSTLCGSGFTACTADQWVVRRAGQVPQHHYWTNDNLKYVFESRDGIHDSCYYSKTYGGACDTPTHVCADRDVDTEGNTCSVAPNVFPRNCGRFDPPAIANDYFGGDYGNLTAGSLCCCTASGVDCSGTGVLADEYANGMFACVGKVSWQNRASLCGAGCTVCTAQQWIDGRGAKVPSHNYWTDDNLKASGWADGICNVSKLYGTDGSPYPMRVCSAHSDGQGNECHWINCGLADIAPPPNEYLGGCSDLWAGTLCCKL
jgi:hypothetical protein